MMSLLLEPCAAQHEHVDMAVVVVIGLHHVQSAHFADQPRFRRPFGERAVAIVAEEAKLIAQAHGRDHQVKISIVIEVVHDDAARQHH